MSETWQNATQTLTAHPAKILSATSEQDVVEFIKDALANNKRIRPAGGGHSWYPLVLIEDSVEPDDGDYYIVKFDKMNHVAVDSSNRLLVEPGATMGDLTPVMKSSGRAFPTEGVIPQVIELGGFIAAGCHGTGWQEPTVPDLVHAITIVLSITDATGNPYVCTFSDAGIEACHIYQGSNKVEVQAPASIQSIAGPDLMSALRVSLGSMGLMSQMSFNTVPMFQLYAQDTTQNDMEEIISRTDPSKLEAHVTGNDYLELFWFPFNSLTPGCNFDVKAAESKSETGQFLQLAECIVQVIGQISSSSPPSILPSKIWLKTANKNQPPPPPDSYPTTVPADDPFETWLGGKALDLLINVPDSLLGIPGWMITLYGLRYLIDGPAYAKANDHYVADAPEVFNYQSSAFPIVDFSFAVPMDLSNSQQAYQNIADAWYAVVDAAVDALQHGQSVPERFPINVTLHARFIKNSGAMISPAYQPPGSNNDTMHTCFIEFLSYAVPPPGENPFEQKRYKEYYAAWDAVCQSIGKKWLALGGQRARPHWAKDWQTIANEGIYEHIRQSFQYDASSQYGVNNLDTFKRLRDTMDPGNMFMNNYIEKIFVS